MLGRVMAAAVLAAGMASQAGAAVLTINFETTPLGFYDSLTVGGYVLDSAAGFEIVDGDPPGGSKDPSRQLYVASGEDFFITRADGGSFLLVNILASALVTEAPAGEAGSLGFRDEFTGSGSGAFPGDPFDSRFVGDQPTTFGRVGFTSGAGVFAVDDIIVDDEPPPSLVPLPASAAVLALALVGLAGLGARRKPA